MNAVDFERDTGPGFLVPRLHVCRSLFGPAAPAAPHFFGTRFKKLHQRSSRLTFEIGVALWMDEIKHRLMVCPSIHTSIPTGGASVGISF